MKRKPQTAPGAERCALTAGYAIPRRVRIFSAPPLHTPRLSGECVATSIHRRGAEAAEITQRKPKVGHYQIPGLWRSIRLTLFVFTLVTSVPPVATTIAKEAQPAEDPQIEQRMKALTQQLRCLVCQNETLADSQADLAEDLRREIRSQMKAGKSDQEILAYLTQRYGDFVLYKPPVKATTYLLWFGPFALLIIGVLVLYRYLRSRKELIADKPLTADERRRAEELLRSET